MKRMSERGRERGMEIGRGEGEREKLLLANNCFSVFGWRL